MSRVTIMNLPPPIQAKTRLIQAWKAGVERVGGERVTRAAMAGDGVGRITHLLAVGKAASAMCAGALERLAEDGRALVVTKYGHGEEAVVAHPRVTLMEAGHPLPDENSLRAGRAVDAFVRSVAAGAELVMLVSGGASALAEVLPESMDVDALQGITGELLAGGYDIEQINAARIRLSAIKGGKLLGRFGGASVRVYAISDVPGDRIDLIGGGIGSIGSIFAPDLPPDIKPPDAVPPPVAGLPDHLEREGSAARGFAGHTKIIGSNRIAREAAAEFLRAAGLPVIVNEETLYRDVHAAAQRIAAELISGPAGAYLWGGEPTVVLPPRPGVGGRNQSLALAVAKQICGRSNLSVLIAGTDGTDGPTNAAGALVDGDTFNAASGANTALLKANAGAYLARIAALFKPGPTGTNVMDLAIAIKR